MILLSFVCSLELNKSTERKLRWGTDVDRDQFYVYIPKWRVPDPTPANIYAKLYDISGIDPWQQLGGSEKRRLLMAGAAQEYIEQLEKLIPVNLPPPAQFDLPIVAPVDFDREHTQTVRYAPRWLRRETKEADIGQPYVPKSALSRAPYPERLLIRVGWAY